MTTTDNFKERSIPINTENGLRKRHSCAITNIQQTAQMSGHVVTRSREDEGRGKRGNPSYNFGPLPIVIPFKLFLDFLRDPVFPRGLTDSQSYVPIFAMSTAERFSTQ